ncbi:MAG: metallophosphoesterase [Lachnospiraceae bacterium]|nr:metallophosphoesterase [Lachnospiraceae bacterium]
MNRVVMLVIFAAVAAVAGAYSFFCIRRLLEFYLKISKKWRNVISALGAVLLLRGCINLWRLPAVISLHILAFFLVFDLLAVFVRRLWRKHGDPARPAYRRCRILYRSGALALLGSALLLGYGAYNMRHIVSTEYKISTQKPIGSYHIILITDTHYDTIQDTSLLKEKAEEISGLHPDIVILGGDIVEEGTSKESMQEVFRVLGGIKSTYGTYYVYGNHDLQPYSGTKQYSREELEAAARAGGVRILRDESVEFGGELILAGRDDAAWEGNSGRASSAEILSGADRGKYIILVDHQPRDFEGNEVAGVDLMLSGHTHAGQVWPAGTILELLGNYNYGLYRQGSSTLIVSSGFTGWGYPLRTQANCEYVQIWIEGAGQKENQAD